MSSECRIETTIPRPLSAAATAEPFPHGDTLIPVGIEICDMQIVTPYQATMFLLPTNNEINGVQSAMSLSAICIIQGYIQNIPDTLYKS
jgi:hypothetical protein